MTSMPIPSCVAGSAAAQPCPPLPPRRTLPPPAPPTPPARRPKRQRSPEALFCHPLGRRCRCNRQRRTRRSRSKTRGGSSSSGASASEGARVPPVPTCQCPGKSRERARPAYLCVSTPVCDMCAAVVAAIGPSAPMHTPPPLPRSPTHAPCPCCRYKSPRKAVMFACFIIGVGLYLILAGERAFACACARKRLGMCDCARGVRVPAHTCRSVGLPPSAPARVHASTHTRKKKHSHTCRHGAGTSDQGYSFVRTGCCY